MPAPRLDTSIASLGPVGRRRAKELAGMGLHTVRDLLLHFPSRHDALTDDASLAAAEAGQNVAVVARVLSAKGRPRFGRRMAMTEARLADREDNVMRAVWFNQPYRAKTLVPGKWFRFVGKVTGSPRYGRQLQNPQVEPVGAEEVAVVAGDAPAAAEAGLLPVYPATTGVSQQVLRTLLRHALPAADMLEDPLPEDVRAGHKLLPIADAVRAMHEPPDPAVAAAARRRIGFDEMLRLQLAVGGLRRLRRQRPAPTVPFNRAAAERFSASMPFTFTAGQRAATRDILADMASGHQMHRLLDGDVGSGKTAVAAVAMCNVAAAGMQAALMAPTEILAHQHFTTLSRLYAAQPFAVALWTGSYRHVSRGGKVIACKRGSADAKRLGDEIADGEVAVVVGTHALVEDAVAFSRLALAVVDEQHRFGVRLRETLCAKGGMDGMEPHLLSMTATPIPRTLALSAFGDLDLSLLKEKPAGRQEIDTLLLAPRDRGAVYDAVRRQIEEGRQAFVVCPLIDPSDTLGAASVTATYDALRKKELKGVPLAVLHGKMPAAEKEKVMAAFLAGDARVLVSTSVIEVGVDVPNATVMCIEGAERFGLSQLHQFRGRIGRGSHKSYCYLLPSSFTATVRTRLGAVVRHADGFSLAEKDLELRGPGDILGTVQSGFPEFLLASFGDARLVAEAKAAAEAILAADPELARYPGLRRDLKSAADRVHLE